MKIVFHHSVAAGGAAMPAPPSGTWSEEEFAHFICQFLDDMKRMLDEDVERLADFGKFAVAEIVRPYTKAFAESIMPDVFKDIDIARCDGPITCHRCRSTGGRHTPRCRR